MQCVSRLLRDLSSDIPVYESKVQRKDGTCRWIEFRTVPIEYEGKRAMLGNLLDITDRKEREIGIMQANRELAAMDGIMQTCLSTSDDTDEKLTTAMAHLIAGMLGTQIGGIFLREENGLVLRALHGSVEDLIEFINEMEDPSILLVKPRAHKYGPGSGRKWMSAPIAFDGGAKGAVVVACDDADGTQGLNFLEKAAGRIGYLLDVCDPSKMKLASEEPLAQIKTSYAPS
jgi:hypothetical protein